MENQPSQPEKSSIGLQPNVASLLCYIPVCAIGLVIGIVFLIIEKESKFVKFHAAQSIVLQVSLIVICIAFWIGSFIMAFIWGPFAMLGTLMNFLIGLAGLIAMIVMMVKSYQNQRYKLPVIGDWAEKLSGGA